MLLKYTEVIKYIACHLLAVQVVISHALAANHSTRIVTLSPNLAEIAVSAGITENLVAVSAFSDFPEWLKNRPVIANSQGVFIESLLALQPDLILAQKDLVPRQTQIKLEQAGLKVTELSITSAKEMMQAIQLLSEYSNDPSTVKITLKQIEANLDDIDKVHSLLKKNYKVFLQYSKDPILTNNQSTLFSQLLSQCGLVNVFSNEINTWPIISKESVIEASPEILLVIESDGSFKNKGYDFFIVDDQQMKIEHLQSLGHHIPSLKHTELIILNPDVFSRETPRMIESTARLCAFIQDNTFKQ